MLVNNKVLKFFSTEHNYWWEECEAHPKSWACQSCHWKTFSVCPLAESRHNIKKGGI